MKLTARKLCTELRDVVKKVAAGIADYPRQSWLALNYVRVAHPDVLASPYSTRVFVVAYTTSSTPRSDGASPIETFETTKNETSETCNHWPRSEMTMAEYRPISNKNDFLPAVNCAHPVRFNLPLDTINFSSSFINRMLEYLYNEKTIENGMGTSYGEAFMNTLCVLCKTFCCFVNITVKSDYHGCVLSRNLDSFAEVAK